MQNQNRIFSPISVDLGAKNTGVSLFHADKPWHYEAAHHIGATLYVDLTNITLSQAGRRSKRHLKRNLLRRKMAKRIFYAILKNEFKIQFDRAVEEDRLLNDYLSHLLNRRGYSFLTLEEATEQQTLEEDILTYSDSFESTKLKKLSNSNKSWVDFIQEKTISLEPIKSIEELLTILELELPEEYQVQKEKDTSNNAKPKIAKRIDYKKVIEKDIFSGFLLLLIQYSELLLSELEKNSGAVHRLRYHENIWADMQVYQPLQSFCNKANITLEQLHRLICHISNMPLKPLRRYFNDVSFKGGDRWLSKRFKTMFTRWIRSWHCKRDSQEHKNQRLVLETLKQHNSILEAIYSLEPSTTIPPFEDQNNRQPPRCQTMLLDPARLDQRYPQWQKILELLMKHYADEYGLNDFVIQQIQAMVKEYQRMPNGRVRGPDQDWISDKSIYLQRILDRTSLADPLRLRLLNRYYTKDISNDEHITFTKQQIEEIQESEKKLLSIFKDKELLKQFKALLYQYHNDIRDARGGLWLDDIKKEPTTLFMRCDRKTKQKKNEKPSLISAITRIDRKQIDEFEKYWKSEKIHGNRTIHGLAKKMEEMRKDAGGEFNEWLKLSKRTDERGQAKAADILDSKILKEIKTLISQFDEAMNRLREKFSLNQEQVNHFNNWFSFCQLYNIIEESNSGFHKTCSCCTEENHLRMETVLVGDKTMAQYTRLSADTGSLFDGQLKLLLDRLVNEVVERKINQLREKLNNEVNNESLILEIPLLIEQNNFHFQHDLNELRKNRTALKKAETKIKRLEDRGKKKDDRIKNASKGICPYTGKKLTDSNGETDHILPRSLSRKTEGAVFNSEMNLIYCSIEGNRSKGNRAYNLSDLSDKYLKKLYGSSDILKIETTIESTLEELTKQNQVIVFDSLPFDQQRDLRHALFSNNNNKIKSYVGRLLIRSNQTRVNGTQQYFIKRLAGELIRKIQEDPISNEERIKGLGFKGQVQYYYKTFDPADKNRKNYRDYLANDSETFKKKEKQGFASHIIDATMLLADHIDEKMSKSSGHSKKSLIDVSNLKKLLPQQYESVIVRSREKYRKGNIKAKPLLKDTMYSVRFLPFIVSKDAIGFGFNPKQCLNLKNEAGNEVFELLKSLFIAPPKTNLVGMSFDELIEKSKATKRGYVYLPIDRRKALGLMHSQFHKKEADAEKQNLAQRRISFLRALEYRSLKKNIVDLLSDQSKKKTSNFINELSDPTKTNSVKKLSLKPSMFLAKDPFNGKSECEIELPFHKSHWLKLSKHSAIKEMKNSKTVNQPELWKQLYSDIFTQFSDGRKHQKVRNVFSLPRTDNPSGAIYVRRRSAYGEDVFQLQAVADEKTIGFRFSKENPKLNKESIETIDIYKKSKNVFLDEDNINLDKSSGTFVKMNEKRVVELTVEEKQGAPWLKLFVIYPASADRRRIELTVSTDKFFDDFSSQFRDLTIDMKEQLYYQLPAGLVKLKTVKDINIFDSIHAAPRADTSAIEILKVNPTEQTISFTYSVGTQPKSDKVESIFNKSIDELYLESEITI